MTSQWPIDGKFDAKLHIRFGFNLDVFLATLLTRTTLSLPADLLAAADQLVRDGKARSRNELIVDALRTEVPLQQRQAVDAAFAGMVDDQEYLTEIQQVAEEFAHADLEAWRSMEQDRVGTDDLPGQ